MAGRRAKWRVAACEAAMQGKDKVTLYGKSGQISAWLSKEELAKRKANWKQPDLKHKKGVLYKYARSVSCASEGCVTDEF